MLCIALSHISINYLVRPASWAGEKGDFENKMKEYTWNWINRKTGNGGIQMQHRKMHSHVLAIFSVEMEKQNVVPQLGIRYVSVFVYEFLYVLGVWFNSGCFHKTVILMNIFFVYKILIFTQYHCFSLSSKWRNLCQEKRYLCESFFKYRKIWKKNYYSLIELTMITKNGLSSIDSTW